MQKLGFKLIKPEEIVQSNSTVREIMNINASSFNTKNKIINSLVNNSVILDCYKTEFWSIFKNIFKEK